VEDIELYQGDSLKVLPDIPDASVDCIVTSPPYWKGFEYEAYFNSYAQYLEWTKNWLAECKRTLAKNGTLWLNVANDSETTVRAFELMEIATRELMFKLHDTVVWYRYNQQPANTDRQLTNQCEFVFMLRHTSAGVELNKDQAYANCPSLFKTKNVGNVWELPFNSGKQNVEGFGRKEVAAKWGHSGFPVELPETCILLSTKEGDTVMDCFMGSGTTGVACKKLGRKFIGIELIPEYVEISRNRIESTGKAANQITIDDLYQITIDDL